MVMRVSTVAFEGIEARAVDVQVQVSPGNVVFIIVKRIKQVLRRQQIPSRWDRTAEGMAG